MPRWTPKDKKPETLVTDEVLATTPGDVGDIPFAPLEQLQTALSAEELVAAMRKPDFIAVKFARLHSPLFFGSKNHGDKLECSQQNPDLSMFWDRANREMHVKFKNEETIITEANVANYTPGERFHKQAQVSSTIIKTAPFTAQVSGPHDHVFAGLGGGKS